MDHDFRKHLLQVASVALLAALTSCASAANTTISDNTRERLADALQASGDSTNAAIVRDLANKKPEPAPDPLTHVSALVAAGQVDQGMREAKAALAARGDDLGFALEVGRLAVKSGRLADAGDVYQQISRRHPDNVEALNGKGVVAAQQGDLKGAADAFRKALALRPRDCTDPQQPCPGDAAEWRNRCGGVYAGRSRSFGRISAGQGHSRAGSREIAGEGCRPTGHACGRPITGVARAVGRAAADVEFEQELATGRWTNPRPAATRFNAKQSRDGQGPDQFLA